MAHTEGHQQVGQRTLLGLLDGPQQVTHRNLAPTFEGQQILRPQPIQIGRVLSQAGLGQQPHRALAQALDIHGPAGTEMDEPLIALKRTFGLDAEGVALALGPHQRGSQRARTDNGEMPRLGALGAQRRHRPDHLGDHVARPAHDDGVAGAHILGGDLILVVQGSGLHRHPTDEHGIKSSEGCGPTGPADGDVDST